MKSMSIAVYTSLCTCSWDSGKSDLIKGGVLNSEVVLYTSLFSWDLGYSPDS